MRNFETDRPDVTESASTLDAGHFQLKTDLFKTEHFKTPGITTMNNYYNAANIKMGITNSLDIQFVVNSLVVSTINNNISKMKTSGFGGVTLRAKQNLMGNDNHQSAIAILPFL